MTKNRTIPELLPLTPPVFHILLALADDERHGYGIMQDVAQQTDGALQLGPGTLYGCLKRMLAAGLVGFADPCFASFKPCLRGRFGFLERGLRLETR